MRITLAAIRPRAPILRQTESVLRAAAFRRRCLSLAKTCSIGFRSDESAGRKSRLAPTGLMALRMAGALWLPGLSRMTQNDNVVWTQGRNRHGFDRGLEYLAVDRSVDDPGRGDPIMTQPGHEGHASAWCSHHVWMAQLAGRHVAVRAALVTLGRGETGVGQALRKVDEIQLRIHHRDGAEKVDHLINDMTAKVTQKPAGRAGLQCMRAVLIHAGFNPPDFAQPPVGNDPAQGLQVGIKAAVLVNAQHHALCLCGPVQFHRASRIGRRRACLR
jgi:hypothetical protein